MIGFNNLLVGPVARLPWRVQTKLLAAFLAIVALLIALGEVAGGDLVEPRVDLADRPDQRP